MPCAVMFVTLATVN